MQHKFFLEQYFYAANKHDVENTLKHFADDAVVHDEGKEHRGLDAIRHWLETSNRNYNTRYTVLNTSTTESEAMVVASVAGTFPGSPIQLTLCFAIEDCKITSLKWNKRCE